MQQQLNYQFRDTSRLLLCFKAAHRSDRDGVADDGNRGLARTGVKVIDLVDKRCLPVVATESRGRMERYMLKIDKADESKDMAHTKSSWIRSKKIRAAACDHLGFTPFILTSVRQGSTMPSEKVRAFTVGAIVGAVFEDLCDQEENMGTALEKVKDLLDLLA